MQRTISVLIVLSIVSSGSIHAEWPGFLGPNRNAVSDETGLAREWGKDGPEVLWSLDVGPGFGSASVSDGQVFLLDREEDTFDVLRCVDLKTGKGLWRTSNEVPGRNSYNGSRGVPSITSTSIIAMGPMGQIYAVDRKSHKILWSVDLVKDYQAVPPHGFGFPQSPLVCGNLVVVAVMTKEAGIVAFDLATGQEQWRTGDIGKGSHSSPILATLAGQKGILFLNNSKLVFVELANGKILWDYNEVEYYLAIPTPTIVDKNQLFLTGGYNGGSVFLEVHRKGNIFSAKERFRLPEDGSQIATMVCHKGHLYGNFTRNENKKNPPGLVCLNLEGKILWQSGTETEFGRGNFILVDNLIFILHGETGELTMIEPNPQSYKELGRVKVLEGEGKNVFAPLAISGGRLIIRDQNKMVCLDLRANKK